MKHKKLLLLWLLLPVPAIAWHYGPGQRYLALDEARGLSRRAARAEQAGQWEGAAALHSQAAARVHGIDGDAKRQSDVATARAQARAGNAAEGLDILDRVLADPALTADPETAVAARELAARIAYHAAWVMRLEGAAREEWLPVAEESRQHFRLLAETAGASAGDAGTSNVEAAVRLQRMSLTELMAKPLPADCQCMTCKQLKEKMCKRAGCKKAACKKPSQPKEGDARENNSGGLGERLEGMGS